jgi:hypothetical protein
MAAKFCPVVPEIWRGQVHGPRKERKRRIIIIIIKNGAKTISLQTLFGRLNNKKQSKNIWPCDLDLQWILTKLGTYLDLKRIWNPIDCQGHRVKFLGEGIRHALSIYALDLNSSFIFHFMHFISIPYCHTLYVDVKKGFRILIFKYWGPQGSNFRPKIVNLSFWPKLLFHVHIYI